MPRLFSRLGRDSVEPNPSLLPHARLDRVSLCEGDSRGTRNAADEVGEAGLSKAAPTLEPRNQL